MKSIMEEASSVSKAIEKAWARAEKPASFTVKVLEHAVKNFFGLTSKPAKIAFYFEEPQVVQPSRHGKAQPQRDGRRPADRPADRNQDARTQTKPAHLDQARKPVDRLAQNARPQRQQSEQKPLKRELTQRSDAQETNHEVEISTASWAPHIRTEAELWLNKAITALRPDARIEYSINKNELQASVNCSLAFNGNERMLCSSLAHLLMQAMRTQFKNETRGLRIHIKTAALS